MKETIGFVKKNREKEGKKNQTKGKAGKRLNPLIRKIKYVKRGSG